MFLNPNLEACHASQNKIPKIVNHHTTQNTFSSQELSQKQVKSHLDQGYLLLNVWFPMPYTFLKPYLTLNEVLHSTSPHVRNQNIAKDPDEALCYIINHFNIKTISHLIQKYPEYSFKQVYYTTYIDTAWYPRLQHLIDLAVKNLQNRNALAQQRLEIHQKYIRYMSSDDLSPYLLQCLL